MRNHTQMHFYSPFLLITVILGALSVQGVSQQPPTSMEPDTSYFKAGDDNWNLIESIVKNNTANVALLLNRGTNPDAVSETGNSALMYATEAGIMEIMTLLVEHGADVNFTGFNNETPLFLAIFANDFQATKYLLEKGANPNVKDIFGVTPLIYASATNQYQSADLLMFYNADETIRDSDGNDPLIAAVTFENLETSDVLLQDGLNPDVQDNEGNTPLIIAVEHGNYDILDLLLDYNADVNIPNNKNYTPLAYAVTYKDVKASTMLVEHGADVNHRISKGRNIAELSRLTGNDTLINLVKEQGGALLKKPDFSEFRFIYGNSFNRTDYLMSFRGSFYDDKYGFVVETGIEYRPFLLKIQRTINDTVFQFRERRIGWSHSLGKNFILYQKNENIILSAYTMLNGFLSFPGYNGSTKNPAVEYNLIPSAGLCLATRYVGIRTGVDWYKFDSMFDAGLKYNLSFFFRIKYPDYNYDRKEIDWE